MTRLCQFGAGRIGQIHAANVAGAGASLAYVVDVNVDAASALAARHGARVADAETALSDPSVDAVIIASSTDTHADLIERAARVGKPIFCEKPVDLSMERVERCVAAVRAAYAQEIELEGTRGRVGVNDDRLLALDVEQCRVGAG